MPTTQFPLLAGDGWVEKNATGGANFAANFATARAATAGVAHYTEQYAYLGYIDDAFFPVNDCNLYRGFQAADTSAIGSGATISAATLYVYIGGAGTTKAGTLCLVAGSQAAGSSLTANDFDNVGSTLLSDTTPTISGLTGWVSFPLNAAGLAAINKTGTTLLATRLSYDRDNSVTGFVAGDQVYAYMRSSEYTTDTSKRPYLEVTYSSSTPAQISGSSSAAATGSLSLTANQLLSGSSNAAASASLSLTTGGPATITPSASNSTATGSFSIASGRPLGSLAANATASGTLSLGTTSAVGSRAAPGWLGMFVLDSSGSSVPLIAGGASATATGTLSLLTPSPQTISGSSQARAIASMLLTVLRGGAALIIRDTYVTSAQFGAKTVSSDTFGDRTVYVHPESTIS